MQGNLDSMMQGMSKVYASFLYNCVLHVRVACQQAYL